MSEAIKGHKNNYVVRSTDLYNSSYGKGGVDFLKTTKKFDNVITNPPFHSAEAFIRKAAEVTRHKFALLLRLAFLEGAKRGTGLFKALPPTRVYVFSQRVTFQKRTDGVTPTKRVSGTTAYAWFVWDMRDKSRKTELRWLPVVSTRS